MDRLAKVVEKYNKYRAPEVEARILRIEEEEFIVKFGGSFCYTCGFYDYIDDFLIELRDAGIDAEIKEIVEEIPEGVTVTFKVGKKST
ncbi:MAG: hypothetical protein QXD66_00125 [Candidatus Nezhaarchaeales archaeon]